MTLDQIFPVKPVVGMVHLLPLPGSPRWGGSMEAVVARARADARALVEGGVGGLIVENYGDAPFFPGVVPAATVAAMSVAAREVLAEVAVPVGINVLRNDASAAVAVAAATRAHFIRVNVHVGVMFTDQGLIEGRAHETLRLRKTLGAPVAILADVMVKHGVAPAGVTLDAAARDATLRGLADGLVITGSSTGSATDRADLVAVRAALPDARIWVGSGVTAETARMLLEISDGLIVGSALQEQGLAGNPVDPHRVRRLVDAVGRL